MVFDVLDLFFNARHGMFVSDLQLKAARSSRKPASLMLRKKLSDISKVSIMGNDDQRFIPSQQGKQLIWSGDGENVPAMDYVMTTGTEDVDDIGSDVLVEQESDRTLHGEPGYAAWPTCSPKAIAAGISARSRDGY